MRILLLRKASAELIGVYALVVAGGGAAIVDTQTHALTHVGVALVFGLVITVMIAAIGHISGGHINPSVSISLAVTGYLSWKDLLFYLLGQFLGAVLGALTLLAFFNTQAAVGMAVTEPAATVSTWQALAIEGVLTAFLVFVVSSVGTDPQGIGKLAAFAIGGTIALDVLWAGPLSGGSMNPARSFGPALISGNWTDLWVYFVGPIAGGIIGALAYQFIRLPAKK
jgi:aquaporin NIP